MRDKQEGRSVRLVGKASGAFGFGSGSGLVTLAPAENGRTRLEYQYAADVGGKVAAVGQRMLGTVTKLLIGQFFRSLERRISPQPEAAWKRWFFRRRSARRGPAVKPAPFDYYRPGSIAEAVGLLAELREEAAMLAGGMTLGPMLNLRMVRPRAVIDISRIARARGDLGDVGHRGDRRRVVQCRCAAVPMSSGATCRCWLALPWVGHFQTRNRGTLGGSVAHADPSAEIPLCLVVCGGMRRPAIHAAPSGACAPGVLSRGADHRACSRTR